ncbi:MAG: TfoX/Sxy family protein [Anaerolineae bacterium]|nr:TfoX/Sxy family protein [Anaerolineae bacterium]
MSESHVDQMDRALRIAVETIRPDVHVTSRNMFGGRGWWANGQMFAAWFGNELALKLPPEAGEALLKLPGAAPAGTRLYVETPPEFLDDPALLEPWVEQSIQLAEQTAARPPKRRSRRP